MNTVITKRFTFESAHKIPHHQGKCKHIHGHSYILEVSVSGEIQTTGPEEGMVIDFKTLSDVVDREIINQWDHQYLNDLVPFTPTAELLAQECFKRIKHAGISVCRVRLWETAKCFVEVTE